MPRFDGFLTVPVEEARIGTDTSPFAQPAREREIVHILHGQARDEEIRGTAIAFV
jgi:hypothetical protein